MQVGDPDGDKLIGDPDVECGNTLCNEGHELYDFDG